MSEARLVTADERRARLGVRHRLAVRAASVEEAAASVVALHGTDPATVFLSACARVTAPGPGPVERALYEDRTLVRMTGMRRTVFVVPSSTTPILHHSCAVAIAVKERKQLIKQSGLDDAWLREVEQEVLATLREQKLATAAQLGELVPRLRRQFVYGEGTAYAGKVSLSTRLLYLMATEGQIVRHGRPSGTWISGQHQWAVAPEMPNLDVSKAQAELVRQWLGAFGPGTEADLKWWTGWTLGDVRKALAAVAAAEVRLEDGVGYVLREDAEPVAAPEPWAALLPALDPTPMGWQHRDWYLPQALRPQLFDRSGNVGPTIWWNGEVVGGWGQRPDGEVVLRLLTEVGADARAAVDREAATLSGWLGGVRVTPRFRTPLERELSA